jgi:hypothetical protein
MSFEASVFASSRRGGRMVEWWKTGMLFLKGNISLINFPRFIPISQKPLFHHSIIPTFQLGRSP